MSPKLLCEEVHQLAPEVALGVVSGEERALVLDHVGGCATCRKHLDDLARTADGLLVLAPSVEPPAGFETRVLSALQMARRPRRSYVTRLLAAAIAGALIAGVGAFVVTSNDRDIAQHYRAALAEANGKYFGVRALVDDRGNDVGHVFAYEGSPSWLVVVVDRAEPRPFSFGGDEGSHSIRLSTQEGQVLDVGSLEAGPAPLVWGGEIPVAVHDLDVVRVRSTWGDTYEARFARDH